LVLRSPPRFLTERRPKDNFTTESAPAAATSAPPQSTAFPHGTGVRKTAPPPWKIHGREDGWSAVHRILHGTDRPLLPAPTHESAHSPHAIFLPGLTQNPGSHRPGPA